MRKLLALVCLALLLGSCAETTGSSADSSPVGSSRPVDSSVPPGGLEERPGRPALVDGEAASCIPMCGEGRVAGGQLPQGLYQTQWFFGGYMTVESDGTLM